MQYLPKYKMIYLNSHQKQNKSHMSIADDMTSQHMKEKLMPLHAMENKRKKCYQYCFVPKCSNTTVSTPTKNIFSCAKRPKIKK